MVSEAGSAAGQAVEGAVSRQERVLRAFTALWLMKERLGCDAQTGLGGKLVSAIGFGEVETEIALGATIAGAALLAVDADAERIKRAMRLGCCDFMVNTLDEAIRVLKNEVRKRRPVSVGLLGDAVGVLDEMAKRGLAPDILAATVVPLGQREAVSDGRAKLRAMGAVEVKFGLEAGESLRADAVDAAAIVAIWSRDKKLRLVRCGVRPGDAQAARRFDESLLADLPMEDTMRRRWLQVAPKYFRREIETGRVVWMSAAEELRSFPTSARIATDPLD